MAKIYQTQEDLQRDIVDKQVQRVHNKSVGEAISGIISWAIGDIAHNFAGSNKFGSFVGYVAKVFAAFDFVKAGFSGYKAHDLALQREQLGPERIVLPPEPQATHEQAHEQLKSFLDHVQKTLPIEPKSLVEQAQRPASTEHSI